MNTVELLKIPPFQYSFYASNNNIAHSMETEFKISVVVPPPKSLITRSRLRLRLQWPSRTEQYHLQQLNRINASLTQALRVRVNPEVTAPKLFIYDVSDSGL